MTNEFRQSTEITTLGGGCFWCLEAVFDRMNGILDVVSGYAGGNIPDPNYELVCTGSTGHAEVVQVVFDPQLISFEEILEVFFSIHDPTTLNRQGNDIGTQYRSIILYHNDQQQKAANKYIKELNASKMWDTPLVTQVVPAQDFYPAEDYHQNYFEKNPYQGYCRVIIAPKLNKFQSMFQNKLKDHF